MTFQLWFNTSSFMSIWPHKKMAKISVASPLLFQTLKSLSDTHTRVSPMESLQMMWLHKRHGFWIFCSQDSPHKLLLWNAWQVLQLRHHIHHDCCCAVCLQLIIPAQYMYTCDFHFIEKRPSYRWLYCNTRLQITIHRSLAVVLFLLLKNVAYKNSLQLFTDRNNKVSWKPG